MHNRTAAVQTKTKLKDFLWCLAITKGVVEW